MKTRIKLLMFGLIALAIITNSCSKDGEVGPIGPQGETGLTGPQGPEGTAGSDGQDGNANVIASDWFEPQESSYSVNRADRKAFSFATRINSNAISLVYYDNDVEVNLLPNYTLAPSGSILKSIDSHINHTSRTLTVIIKKFGSNLTPGEYLWDPAGPPYGKGVRFRHVIIPNGTSSKNSGINFKKMTYEQVMDHFGLDY